MAFVVEVVTAQRLDCAHYTTAHRRHYQQHHSLAFHCHQSFLPRLASTWYEGDAAWMESALHPGIDVIQGGGADSGLFIVGRGLTLR